MADVSLERMIMLRQNLKAVIANAPAAFDREVLSKVVDKLSDEEIRALYHCLNTLTTKARKSKRHGHI